MKFPEYTSMSVEERLKRLEELRVQWKKEPDPVKRKIITAQGKLLKLSLPKEYQTKI